MKPNIRLTKHSIERFEERFKHKNYSNVKSKMNSIILYGIKNNKLLQSKDKKDIQYLRVGKGSYFVLSLKKNLVEVITFVDRIEGSWINFIFNKVKLYG